MYEVLTNYLENGHYTITDAQSRIDYGVARGTITPEQAATLLAIAQTRAEEIDPADVTALSARVDAAEGTLQTHETEIEQIVSGLEALNNV